MPLDNPLASTDNIWRDQDMDRCLSDDLDDIEAGIDALEISVAGKAESTHEHGDIYAAAEHEHGGYAESMHEHDQSSVIGLEDTLNEKAWSNHVHDEYATADHGHIAYSSTASASAYKLIYLATDGDDENDGFSASAPMATIKGVIKKHVDTYKSLDIRLADGTYTENIGTIAVDACNLSIRSVSADKEAVTINMASALELSVNLARLYNMTLNVTTTDIRPICVQAGNAYLNNLRINVPEDSTYSCVNVYNGSSAFIMGCVLNSGTGSSAGACVYGNQALLIKAINCTSERTVTYGFYAYNGTDIIYTPTLTATTMTRESTYGKCTIRTSSAETKLWSGAYYMKAEHTITPSKTLSECQNGWILLWSDYDTDDSTTNNGDFVTTVIPKLNPSGDVWEGKSFYCDIPRYIGSDQSDVTTESRIMKMIYIYDDKIVGHAANNQDTRTDVVLRAIYEF